MSNETTETKKLPEDKKPAPPRAAQRAPATSIGPFNGPFEPPMAPSRPAPAAGVVPVASLNFDRIHVALIRFDRAMEVPGKQLDTSAMLRTEAKGTKSWAVEYLPGFRHFRITYEDAAKKETKVGYVHETRALSWEPAA